MSAIYDPAYPIRWLLSVNSAQVTGSHSGFPVCVRLADLGSQFFADLGPVGGKLRVTDVSGTVEYAYDLAHYDQGAEKGKLFVKMDIDDVTDKQFYVFVGNNGATPYAPGDPYGRNALWPNHGLMSHDGGRTDSSPNGATPSASANVPGGSGKISDSTVYNGSSSHVTYPANNAYHLNGDFRISTWIKIPPGASSGVILRLKNPNPTGTDAEIYLAISATDSYFQFTGSNDNDLLSFTNAAYGDNVWRKLDLRYTASSSIMETYINQVMVFNFRNFSYNNIIDRDANLEIGKDGSGTWLNAELEEIQYIDMAHSLNWVRTEYDNQNDPSAFITVVGRELNGNPFTPKIIIL